MVLAGCLIRSWEGLRSPLVGILPLHVHCCVLYPVEITILHFPRGNICTDTTKVPGNSMERQEPILLTSLTNDRLAVFLPLFFANP